MLKTTILVCLWLSVPNPVDCTRDTALDVFAFPATHTATCGNDGQATLAKLAIAPEQGKSYPKIICERLHDEANR